MLTSLLTSLSDPIVGIVALVLALVVGVVAALLHSYGQALRCRHCGGTATQFDPGTGRALCDHCIAEIEAARAARTATGRTR